MATDTTVHSALWEQLNDMFLGFSFDFFIISDRISLSPGIPGHITQTVITPTSIRRAGRVSRIGPKVNMYWISLRILGRKATFQKS